MHKEFMKNLFLKYYYFIKTMLFTLPLDAVEIETTTICNRKCEYCPNSTIGREPNEMEESTFYKIIDSLKKINYTGRISPHFYGEPLTDDRLVKFIRYARTNLPNAIIKLYTNGDFLTADKYMELKKAGVDIFRISQHSKEPSSTIIHTLEHIKTNNPEIYTVKYVNFYNEYYNKKNCDNLLNNRGGTVAVNVTKRSYCHLVNQITFDYTGNAVLCCNDYSSSLIFGNIMDKEVNEIWENKEYVTVRNKIMRGNWIYELCRKCAG